MRVPFLLSAETGVRAGGRLPVRFGTLNVSLWLGGQLDLMRSLNSGILAWTAAAGLLVSAGCTSTGRDRLESTLRRREAGIRELERQLAAAEKQLRDQENELLALQQVSGDSSFRMASSAATLETAAAWGSVRKLRIHTLASGILRTEDDELTVSVIVQPLDDDGEVVKVAGLLSLRLQLPGETSLLAETTVTTLESRSAWSSGLIARGFRIEIPLDENAAEQSLPGREILATATLDLGDDRHFTTSRLLRVPE